MTLFCFLLQEQKEGPAGEAYRPSPSGDSAAPKAITNYPPPGRRANYAFAKDSAPPTGNKNLDLKSLLPAFSHRKVPSPGGVQIKTLYKILRRRQATTNRPPRQRCSPSFAQGSTPPKATAILPQIKFFFPAFLHRKVSPRGERCNYRLVKALMRRPKHPYKIHYLEKYCRPIP